MTLRSPLGAGAAAAAVLILGLGAPAHAASTVVVYEDTAAAQGWVTGDMRGAGAVDFTADGLVISTPVGADKAQFGTAVSVRLADLTALSYETTVLSPGSIPEQRVALNLVIDENGSAPGGFATLVYEPVYNAGLSTDALLGGDAIWWSTRVIPGVPTSFTSYVPLADIIAANPDATVSAVLLNQGTGNPGLQSLVPSVTIGDSTFEFRDGAPPVALGGKAECKDGGWRTSAAPEFRNQGECVSYFTSNR